MQTAAAVGLLEKGFGESMAASIDLSQEYDNV